MLAMVLAPLLVLGVALVGLAMHWLPLFAALLARIADSLETLAEVAQRRPPPGPALPYGGDLVRAVRITHDRVNELDRRWVDFVMLRGVVRDHLKSCAAQPDDAAAHPADKPDEHTESNP